MTGFCALCGSFSKKKRHFVDIDYSDSLVRESRTASAMLILRAKSILTRS
jgi:hypothetical protein